MFCTTATLRPTLRTGFAISASVIFERDSSGTSLPMQHNGSKQAMQIPKFFASGRTPNALMPSFPTRSAFGLAVYVAAPPVAPFGVAHLVLVRC